MFLLICLVLAFALCFVGVYFVVLSFVSCVVYAGLYLCLCGVVCCLFDFYCWLVLCVCIAVVNFDDFEFGGVVLRVWC